MIARALALAVAFVLAGCDGVCQDRSAYEKCVASGNLLCIKLETNLPDCEGTK